MKTTTISKTKDRDGRPASLNGSSSPDYDAVVIGAGPYGLSAAAYLKGNGMSVRVFGEPMEFWGSKMPVGMLLRSPREGSHLADPKSALTMDAFEAATGRQPLSPVPLEHFVEYGRWFRQQAGLDLDSTSVSQVSRESSNSSFKITLANGTALRSRRVVVAAGVGSFQRKPAPFADLPEEMASHCYEGRTIADLCKKRVAVIGAGQSALESAALLHEAGGNVEVIAKISQLRWVGMHGWMHHLGPISKMLYSKYDVGPAGISRLVATPTVVSYFPMGIKDKIRTRAVRPAGAKWLPERLTPVKFNLGRSVKQAKAVGGEVQLVLDDGTEKRVDHVLMGTGYTVDIAKYNFLPKALVNDVRQLNGYPALDPGFCSSIPGLHFVGATAARTFGPLLYFVAGTEYASKRLAAHVRPNGVRA